MAIPLLQAAAYTTLAWVLYKYSQATVGVGVLLFSVRLWEGIGTGMNSMSDNVAREVATPQEHMSLSMWMVTTIMIGVAAGPCVCSLGLCASGEKGSVVDLKKAATPAALVSSIEIAVALVFSLAIPNTLEDLKEVPDDAPDVQEIPSTLAWNEVCAPGTIVTLCGAAFCIDSLSTLMLESSTSLILQKEYGFDVWVIGLLVGSVFGVSALAVFFAGIVSEYDIVSPTLLAGLCLMLVCCGSALLFDYGPDYQILIGDVLVYPTEGTVMSLALGLMYNVADPNAWYSIDVLNFLVTAWDGIARIFSPTLGRYVIDIYGRNTYACIQLILSVWAGTFLLIQVCVVRRLLNGDSSTEKDHTGKSSSVR